MHNSFYSLTPVIGAGVRRCPLSQNRCSSLVNVSVICGVSTTQRRPHAWNMSLFLRDNQPACKVLPLRMPKRRKTRRGGELLVAKTRLADAVAALADKRLHTTRSTDGKTRHTRLQSRYDELAEAVESARGGSGGKWNHQLPFWADAFVLLREIDDEITKMHPAPSGWPGWTRQRLAALTQRQWRPQDCQLIYKHVATFDALCARIDKLFAPKPIALPDACPECKTKTVYRDSDGERVRTPALQITEDGCTCGHCKTNWPIDHLPLLGSILGYASRESLLAS